MTSVQTVITNKTKTIFNLTLAKGRIKTLRGGETVRLDYDLKSFLGKSSLRELERAIAKGKIEFTTKILTGDSTITVDQDGGFRVKAGIEPDSKKAIKPQIPKKVYEAPEDMGATGRVADRSRDKMTRLMGMSTEDLNVGPAKDIDISTGKEMPGTSIFENHKHVAATDAASVFKGAVSDKPYDSKEKEPVKEPEKEAVKEAPIEEAPNEPDEEPEETPNDPEETSAEQAVTEEQLPEDVYVNDLLAKKDFTLLFAYLTDTYPEQFAATTKAAIRKCKTYADVRAKLGLDETA